MYQISLKELWALTHPKTYLKNYLKRGKPSQANFVLSFDIDLSRDAENIPNLLNELKIRNLKATFAVVGMLIEKYPKEHQCIVADGHEIINHTYSHPDSIELCKDKYFDKMTKEEKREEMLKCHHLIADILHYQCKGFRVPHFGNLFTQDIYPILKELNYLFSTSTLCTNTPYYGQPYIVEGNITEFPVLTCPYHPFSSFDSWHCIKRPKTKFRPGALHAKKGEFLRIFKVLMNHLIDYQIYGSLYFDPADMVKGNDTLSILDFLSENKSKLNITHYANLLENSEYSK